MTNVERNAGPARVVLAPEALRALLAAHASAARVEPCALLLGRAEPRGVRVLEAVPARNAHPEGRDAFAIEPTAVLGAGKDARTRGLGVVGAWHGHLRGPAWLSRADEAGLREAAVAPAGAAERPPYAYLVTGRGAGHATVLRAFVVRASGEVVEARVVAARE